MVYISEYGLAGYILALSCTADSDLAESGLARYAPPRTASLYYVDINIASGGSNVGLSAGDTSIRGIIPRTAVSACEERRSERGRTRGGAADGIVTVLTRNPTMGSQIHRARIW